MIEELPMASMSVISMSREHGGRILNKTDIPFPFIDPHSTGIL
jgi:hypothetical protein